MCVCVYWWEVVCKHVPDMMHGGRVMGDTCVAVTTVSRGPVWILLAASDMSAAADATAAGVHVKAYPSLAHSLHLALVSSSRLVSSPAPLTPLTVTVDTSQARIQHTALLL